MAAAQVFVNPSLCYQHEIMNASYQQGFPSYYYQKYQKHPSVSDSVFIAPMMSSAAYTQSTYSPSRASDPFTPAFTVGPPPFQLVHNICTNQQEWLDAGLGTAEDLPSPEIFPSGLCQFTTPTMPPYDGGYNFVGQLLEPSDNQPDTLTMAYSSYISSLPPASLPSPLMFPARQVYPLLTSLPDLSSYESDRSALCGGINASSYHYHPCSTQARRKNSITSYGSQYSHDRPKSSRFNPGGNIKGRGRCPNPDCSRIFRDLKAHMLTHQAKRPQKCPIVDCAYHIKGFSRKYDRYRHTLTHFRGTTVCDFCPSSVSFSKKSFHRVQCFKLHLISVHGVESYSPNSRKSPSSAIKPKNLEGKVAECSFCSSTFKSPGEFYNHLDDCILKYLVERGSSEGFGAHH